MPSSAQRLDMSRKSYSKPPPSSLPTAQTAPPTCMRAMLNAPQPVAPDISTVPPTSAQPTTRLTQPSSPSKPVTSPSTLVSSLNTNNPNRLALFLAVVMAAVLLIGVLVGTYVTRNGGNDEPFPVSIPTQPPPTAVRPAEVPATGVTAIAQIDGMVQVYVPEGHLEMGSTDDDDK